MQITLKNLHPATTPGISEGEEGAFPSPSLFLAKATDQLQKEVSIDKTISIIKFYVFGPILQPITKHWGHKAEQETQCIQEIHPTILSGELLCAQHFLGAKGHNLKKSHKALGLRGSITAPKHLTPDSWGEGGREWSHMGSNSLCYLCFSSVFQNNISE